VLRRGSAAGGVGESPSRFRPRTPSDAPAAKPLVPSRGPAAEAVGLHRPAAPRSPPGPNCQLGEVLGTRRREGDEGTETARRLPSPTCSSRARLRRPGGRGGSETRSNGNDRRRWTASSPTPSLGRFFRPPTRGGLHGRRGRQGAARSLDRPFAAVSCRRRSGAPLRRQPGMRLVSGLRTSTKSASTQGTRPVHVRALRDGDPAGDDAAFRPIRLPARRGAGWFPRPAAVTSTNLMAESRRIGLELTRDYYRRHLRRQLRVRDVIYRSASVQLRRGAGPRAGGHAKPSSTAVLFIGLLRGIARLLPAESIARAYRHADPYTRGRSGQLPRPVPRRE